MTRQSLVVQVFVASPSDVSEERAILETVIVQLNLIWSRTLGLTFELLRWETAVRPAFAPDPQAAINDQIGSDYDVLIGIVWGRLGTETPRAISGTVEEFERAHARLKSHGTLPEIMLYFKDAPIAPSKIDPAQLKGVQDFKRSLSDKGGVYSEFEDLAGFESSLRAHLSAVAQKFSCATQTASLPTQSAPQAEETNLEEDEEYGLIDYIEIYETKIAEMTTAIDVINQATVRVGEQIRQRTEEMLSAGSPDAKTARRFIKRAADDMNSYADNIRAQVPTLSAARVVCFGALSNALALRGDFVGGDDQLRTLRDSLASMEVGTQTAKNGMAGMRTSTEALPRISKELNKAKRAVISQLDAFLGEIDSTQSTVSNIVEAIDRMLGNPRSTGSST